MSGENYSIVEFFGSDGGHRCGYCKSEHGNHSEGMWAHEMTPRDYQDLIDRGWRRSGKYCYKPTMSVMCCPMYTIKCAVKDFVISKSQKKNLKTFAKYIVTGVRGKSDSRKTLEAEAMENRVEAEGEVAGERDPSDGVEVFTNERGPSDGVEVFTNERGPSHAKLKRVGESGDTEDARMKSATASVEDIPASGRAASLVGDPAAPTKGDRKKAAPAKGVGADPNKPKAVKAKLLRKEKRLAKQGGGGGGGEEEEASMPNEEASTRDKSIGEASSMPNSDDDASLRISNAPSNSNSPSNASKALLPPKSLEDLISESERVEDPKIKFEIKLVKSNPPSEEFEATFKESFRLYKKYQMIIHEDEESKCTEKQFKRFLCHSPLFPAESGDASIPFGSYHQHYRLDGRLIAVGVVDVLPSCVSSVYLYYDPEFHFLTLGTFTALREIYFTRQLTERISSIEYYYMGFYIHSCPKMRYKGAYHPSFLLCPEVNTWHDIGVCKPKLDMDRYQRFNSDPSAADPSQFDGDLGKVKILHKGFPMSYEMFRRYKKEADDEREVTNYAKLIGKSCGTILLYRH